MIAALSFALLLFGNAEPGAAQVPQEPRRNVLLLCVDDLRPELCRYGVEHAITPNIDQLHRRGRAFTRHYVQAPTCGASRFSLLTGRVPRRDADRGNDALVRLARSNAPSPPTLPHHFRAHGYTTVALGKVSHHPGGRFGEGWNDPSRIEMPGAWDRHEMPVGAWRTPQGTMHALAAGHVRGQNDTPAVEAFDGPDDSYPDGLTVVRALEELDALAKEERPFFLAVGLIRPHLPFGAPARYFEPYREAALPPIPHPHKPAGRTTWHGSGEFFGRYLHGDRDPREDSEYADLVRRHYLACVSYADALVGRLLERVRELGLEQNTAIVLWGDHGWHLGEHAVWGKHTLFEESLRAPLIVAAPDQRAPGVASAAVVETLDLYPTLCELCDLPVPDGLDGRSLGPQLENPDAPGHTAVSVQSRRETIRTDRYRLIRHRNAEGTQVFLELYDHASEAGETRNVAADHPEVVPELLEQLDERLR